MEKKLITIIIPVYMNEGSLYPSYINLTGMLKEFCDEFNYEIIFINDGSKDKSGEELCSIKKIDDRVKIISFTRNFGQLSAIYAGFGHAEGDLLVTISADMQDPPELISQMIRKWQEGYKFVACKRTEREDSFIAEFSSKIFYRIINMTIPQMPRGGYDCFLLDKIVYKKIFDLDERNNFLQGDIMWLGYEPYFIGYKRLKRKYGKSQWTLAKKIKGFIDGIINTSYFPIRIMSLIGIITSMFAFIYIIVVFLAWFYNSTPFSGYAPIISILLFTTGLIMIMLGIIGEYLWRTYDQVRGRPRYIIKESNK
ncbi:MAG: glycosyltransferase [Ignavibacteriae bacterium]|nr:MAG: glycosyltransferase [Ignavibacteriota bacterium]